MVERHFVDFFWPGIIFADHTVKQISSWDEKEALEIWKSFSEKNKPYGFQFFTKARTDEELDSKEVKRSGTYFINGTILSLDEIEREGNPGNRILINNMRCNGWDKIVRTMPPCCWTQPFEEDDKIITLEE